MSFWIGENTDNFSKCRWIVKRPRTCFELINVNSRFLNLTASKDIPSDVRVCPSNSVRFYNDAIGWLAKLLFPEGTVKDFLVVPVSNTRLARKQCTHCLAQAPFSCLSQFYVYLIGLLCSPHLFSQPFIKPLFKISISFLHPLLMFISISWSSQPKVRVS